MIHSDNDFKEEEWINTNIAMPTISHFENGKLKARIVYTDLEDFVTMFKEFLEIVLERESK